MAARSGSTLAVEGVTDLLRGLKAVEKQERLATRKILRHTGDAVKGDAAGRFATYDAKSAAGYRTVVRQRGVSVEQKYRRTTGLHPEFGALQMRKALAPALVEQAPETRRAMEHALDEIARRFNR